MTATSETSRIASISAWFFAGLTLFCTVCAFALLPLGAFLMGPMRWGDRIAVFPFVVYGIGAVFALVAIVIGTRRANADKEVPHWVWMALMAGLLLMISMGSTPMMIECFGVGGACDGAWNPGVDRF